LGFPGLADRPAANRIGPTRRAFAAGLGGVSVLTTSAAAWAHGRAPVWPDGRRAAVSLTYDDGLDSQLDNAIPQLDALGLKATFFVTGENMDARLKDWVAVGRAGHEIADHTVSHPCELGAYTAGDFQRRELGAMETYLDNNFGAARGRSFAYPCGVTDLGRGTPRARRARYLRLLRADFTAARTVAGPPNDPRRLAQDRYALHAFEPTYDQDRADLAFAYVAKAVARGHWAILVFHEVKDKRVGEGDTSLAVHGAILKGIAEAPVWCAPMSGVLGYLQGTRPGAI
jgi:peptidoglycan/xylan/chitin deacetylase (PgdA/CDA1 family)